MKNIGDASSAITACSLSGAASTVSGTTVVSSGQSSSATCTGAPSGTVPGERVQGSFTFSSGIIITFAGFYE
jgi:outer membrane lipoprotein SlyB